MKIDAIMKQAFGESGLLNTSKKTKINDKFNLNAFMESYADINSNKYIDGTVKLCARTAIMKNPDNCNHYIDTAQKVLLQSSESFKYRVISSLRLMRTNLRFTTVNLVKDARELVIKRIDDISKEKYEKYNVDFTLEMYRTKGAKVVLNSGGEKQLTDSASSNVISFISVGEILQDYYGKGKVKEMDDERVQKMLDHIKWGNVGGTVGMILGVILFISYGIIPSILLTKMTRTAFVRIFNKTHKNKPSATTVLTKKEVIEALKKLDAGLVKLQNFILIPAESMMSDKTEIRDKANYSVIVNHLRRYTKTLNEGVYLLLTNGITPVKE